VKGGATSFGGGGVEGPAAKPADRLKNLPGGATAKDRAIAGMLDNLDMRNVPEAERFVVEAEALAPGDPLVAVGRGRLMVQTGKVQDALRLFGEVIKRSPDFMPAWHYNGMAHMLSGDPTQAVQSWEKIKAKDPAYFAENNLDKRVEVARRMAGGGR
jgi:predicted Zn-dependent protease